MFVGGDVTHPTPDQTEIPSVVGVAASYDQYGFRYNCSWRLQGPREEMITDFENILLEHLNFYKSKNGGVLPKKIMYYRDGVSDGQFQEVLDIEMTAIRKACGKAGPQYKPQVTFIICQKRHHTRFFPKGQDGEGKNNNVKPGTVVDKDIIHPHQYQFFLASHAAIQGVTKPTKYCVLWDDSNIAADDLQVTKYLVFKIYIYMNQIFTIILILGYHIRSLPFVHTLQSFSFLCGPNLLRSFGRCTRKKLYCWPTIELSKLKSRI